MDTYPARPSFFMRYKRVLLYIGVCVVLFLIGIASQAAYNALTRGSAGISSLDSALGTSCNVQGIELHGPMYSYIPKQGTADDPNTYQQEYGDAVSSESVVSAIREADADSSIKAILLEVDSGGGVPIAGEEIATALKNATKPTVVVIRQSGMSAAYWAATGASYIFASANSDVGSIGVTSSYLDNVGKNKQDGNAYIQLSSGKYKDTGSPDKPLSEDERALIMRDVKIMHENFVAQVARNRNLPIEDVRAIADGSSVLGERAKELGLIDAIGSWTEAEQYLQGKINDKALLCWK